jgi:hypothetical protein
MCGLEICSASDEGEKGLRENSISGKAVWMRERRGKDPY